MSKPKYLYIREEDGSVTPIQVVLGVYSKRDLDGISQNAAVVAALNPDLVITRKEYERQMTEHSKKIYETNFKPLVDALRTHRQLTPRQLSRITEKPEKEVKQSLDRMYKANLLGKNDGSYTMTTENMKEIASLFGLKEK